MCPQNIFLTTWMHFTQIGNWKFVCVLLLWGGNKVMKRRIKFLFWKEFSLEITLLICDICYENVINGPRGARKAKPVRISAMMHIVWILQYERAVWHHRPINQKTRIKEKTMKTNQEFLDISSGKFTCKHTYAQHMCVCFCVCTQT